MDTVGDDLYGVAFSPDGRRAYAMNGGAGSVMVIDTGNSTVTDTIAVGGCPWGVAVSPNGRRAYVTIRDDPCGSRTPRRPRDRVSVIDTGRNIVIDSFAVDGRPLGVAVSPNGRRAYILINRESGFIDDLSFVWVIDTYDNEIVDTLPFTGDYLWGVAISQDGRRAYITNSPRGLVLVVDTGSRTVTSTITVGSRPTGVAVSPDGRRVYAANSGSDSVSVIDTGRNTIIDTIAVGSEPISVAVCPDGRRVCVANRSSDSMSVIDVGSNMVTSTTSVGSHPHCVAVSPDGRCAYVTNKTVSVIKSL